MHFVLSPDKLFHDETERNLRTPCGMRSANKKAGFVYSVAGPADAKGCSSCVHAICNFPHLTQSSSSSSSSVPTSAAQATAVM